MEGKDGPSKRVDADWNPILHGTLEDTPRPSEHGDDTEDFDLNCFHRFPELPVEVKEQIYEWALLKERKSQIPPALQVAPPTGSRPERTQFPSLPAMCLTNKLERSIATLVLARNTILRLSCLDVVTFIQFMDDIGVSESKFMTAVKKVQLVYSDFHFNTNLIFASTLPVLIDLTITIAPEEIIEMNREPGPRGGNVDSNWDFPSDEDMKAATRNHMLNMSGLNWIAECKALTRLTFQITNLASIYEISCIEYWEVDHVAKVCQESFMEGNGKALSVDMICDYKGKPRRLKIGKDSPKDTGSTIWKRMNKGFVWDGDEALHWELEWDEW